MESEVREDAKINSEPHKTSEMMRQYDEEEEEEEDGVQARQGLVQVIEEAKPFKPLEKNMFYIEKSIFVISKYPFFEQFERIL